MTKLWCFLAVILALTLPTLAVVQVLDVEIVEGGIIVDGEGMDGEEYIPCNKTCRIYSEEVELVCGGGEVNYSRIEELTRPEDVNYSRIEEIVWRLNASDGHFPTETLNELFGRQEGKLLNYLDDELMTKLNTRLDELAAQDSGCEGLEEVNRGLVVNMSLLSSSEYKCRSDKEFLANERDRAYANNEGLMWVIYIVVTLMGLYLVSLRGSVLLTKAGWRRGGGQVG